MKTKLKRRRFDAVENMQAVLNTLTVLPGCISKVAEMLGSVCALSRGLL
jgi:hypothetical protein